MGRASVPVPQPVPEPVPALRLELTAPEQGRQYFTPRLVRTHDRSRSHQTSVHFLNELAFGAASWERFAHGSSDIDSPTPRITAGASRSAWHAGGRASSYRVRSRSRRQPGQAGRPDRLPSRTRPEHTRRPCGRDASAVGAAEAARCRCGPVQPGPTRPACGPRPKAPERTDHPVSRCGRSATGRRHGTLRQGARRAAPDVTSGVKTDGAKKRRSEEAAERRSGGAKEYLYDCNG